MPRTVNAAAAALLLAAAFPARAQLWSATDRARGLPEGIALPVPGAAAAEEPTALAANPAGIGFVDSLALQYFHEGQVTPGSVADGVWAAGSLGPLALGLSEEWMRPGQGETSYRRTRLGLALGDGRAFEAGVAWNWTASSDPGLRQGGYDLGLTLRPVRRLSLALALLQNDAYVNGERLPLRYDLGLAVRALRDRLTVSGDLLADDRGSGFRSTHLAFGAALEAPPGLAIGAGVQIPVADVGGVRDPTAYFVTLGWNLAHSGVTGGAVPTSSRSGWLAGARLSQDRYLAARTEDELPTLDLARELAPGRTLLLAVGERDPYGALVERLIQVRDDPAVGALLLRIDGLPLGGGRVEELRALVGRIRARKPVVAYLTGGGTREYWLATAATAVAAPPGAPLLVNGLSSSQLFIKDTLARIGVAFEVVKAGAYKSATEPLVRSGASPEAREATNALLDDVFDRFVGDVAADRRLAPDRVRALVDQGLFTAEEAKAAGLVDAALWPDELEGFARGLAGRPLHGGGRYDPADFRAAQRWGRPPVIEIVRVEGMIAPGKSRRGLLGVDGIAGAETVAAQLRSAAEDREVRAIVLRVESPGGDGLASDLIWREVARARRRGKPVVASMGDLAASGGYLVAAGADAIVAEPSTLTGSIGVFAVKPDLSGLMEKLSVHREAFTRGENAQITSLARPWSPSERGALEKQIQAFYALFLDRVAEGRKLPRAEVEAVAGGRVWTGRQAFDRKLVDRLGSLTDALAVARQLARLPPGAPVEIRRAGGGPAAALSALGPELVGERPEPVLAELLSALPELRALAALSELGPVLALPEEWLPVEAPPAPGR
ncbi:MAG TPA: signal peptide peptidase SppA [Anaeromyxobacter sp.]|nr:signal peptide peptidase SppA [Anaeromyxobacter sp.]